MSFPQPAADDYAVNNYQLFRLNTPLSSPGDIYESPQGGHLVCVGPQSDIANINVAYFDDQVPGTFLQFATISPTRSFVGFVSARNEARFAPAHRPGRILCWADDIYDPSFRPRGFTAPDTIEFVPPQLDMIQYFTPLSSVVPPRSDKTFVFQNYKVATGGRDNIVVPYYGRKYCYVQFTNRNAVTANIFGITGVNYAITQNGTSNPYTQETAIRAPASVAAGASVTVVITAQNQGMFDALLFSVNEAGPAPLRVVMSDTGV